MKRDVTRTGKLLGGYVPQTVSRAVEVWVGSGSERTISRFLREAAVEKLQRENIPVGQESTEGGR